LGGQSGTLGGQSSLTGSAVLQGQSSRSNSTVGATDLLSKSTNQQELAKVAPTTSTGSSAPPATTSTDLPAEVLLKFHSAVRWAKPWSEIEAAASDVSLQQIVGAKDPKNGNTALHIAAQNGHLDIVRRLLAEGGKADGVINKQNGKGQTPLHMSVEYDFYFVSKLLLEAGASKDVKNEDGHKAILGIDGGKVDKEAWDNQVIILRAATTQEQLDFAFAELEKGLATPELISKEQLIQTGMAKKKNPETKDIWDHKRFMSIAAKF
jgi:hypothetical protein